MRKLKYKGTKTKNTVEHSDKNISFAKSLRFAKKRILVADDDPSIREVFKMILERAGYEVEFSETGHDIMKGECSIPDIYLVDKQLSGLNGLELCRHLKTQKKTKNIPVLMISANPDIAALSEDAGADGYIEKPFEMRELLKTIEKHLNSKERKTTKSV